MHPYDGRVVSNFILQGLKGEPLTVYGDGYQTRSFMFIHDLVDGLISLMDAPADDDWEQGDHHLDNNLGDLEEEDENEPALGIHGPVNLGNMGEFTIAELVRAVAEAIHQVRFQQGNSTKIDDPLVSPTTKTHVVPHRHPMTTPASTLHNTFPSSPMTLMTSPLFPSKFQPVDQPKGQEQQQEAILSREYICGQEVVYCPIPTDDPTKRRPDTTRAHQLLNWHPRWSLKEGLLEMVHYYQQKIDAGEL